VTTLAINKIIKVIKIITKEKKVTITIKTRRKTNDDDEIIKNKS
jgi:hypothetical protein